MEIRKISTQRSRDQEITIVSDGRLRNRGGFGWVAATNEEITAMCNGAGKIVTVSSFCIEATGMYTGMTLFSRIAKKLESKMKVLLWTDNKALVERMNMMAEFNPASAYRKNDPYFYVGICKASSQLEIIEIGHVRDHQDITGQTLSPIKKH